MALQRCLPGLGVAGAPISHHLALCPTARALALWYCAGVVHPTISQDLSAQNSFATPLGNLGPEEPPVEQVPPTAGQLASPTPQGGAAAVEAKPAPKSKDPSPQRGRQVKSTRSSGGGAADLSKNWNPYVSKPVDTSLALKKPGSVHNEPAARPQGARKAPSSPTREERQKRKQWAEVRHTHVLPSHSQRSTASCSSTHAACASGAHKQKGS